MPFRYPWPLDPQIVDFGEAMNASPDARRALEQELAEREAEAQARLSKFSPSDFYARNTAIIRGINQRQARLKRVRLERFIVNVEDADTLVLRKPGFFSAVRSAFGYGDIQVRLAGIDAPEVGGHGFDPLAPVRIWQEQPGGQEASQALRSLIEQQQDNLTLAVSTGRRTYGRYLGALGGTEGANLNLELLRQGAATALPFGKSSEDIISRTETLEAERDAQIEGLGLWQYKRYQAQAVINQKASRRITHNILTRMDRLSANQALGSYASWLASLGEQRGPLTFDELMMANTFSGFDDQFNTIEGLRHRGMASERRKRDTHFGSGLQRPMFLFDLETTGLSGLDSSILALGYQSRGRTKGLYAKSYYGDVMSEYSRQNIWSRIQKAVPPNKFLQEKQLLEGFLGALQQDPNAPLAGWNIGYSKGRQGFDISFLTQRMRTHGLGEAFGRALSGRTIRDLGYESIFQLSLLAQKHRQVLSPEVLANWAPAMYSAQEVYSRLSSQGLSLQEIVEKGTPEFMGKVRRTPKGWSQEFIHGLVGLGTYDAHGAVEDVLAMSNIAGKGLFPDTPEFMRAFNRGVLEKLRPPAPDKVVAAPGPVSPPWLKKNKLFSWWQGLPTRTKWWIGGGALGAWSTIGLFGYMFSGKDDEYNTIEGLGHKGIAHRLRRQTTDFGSGFMRAAIAKGVSALGQAVAVAGDPLLEGLSNIRQLFSGRSLLFHGTSTKAARSIIKQGLLSSEAGRVRSITHAVIASNSRLTKESIANTVYLTRSRATAGIFARQQAYLDQGVAAQEAQLRALNYLSPQGQVVGFDIPMWKSEFRSMQILNPEAAVWKNVEGYVRHVRERREAILKPLGMHPHLIKALDVLQTRASRSAYSIYEKSITFRGSVSPERIIKSKSFIPLREPEWEEYANEHLIGTIPSESIGYIRKMLFSGFDDRWNTISGLQEGGLAGALRKKFTDFGSGWLGRAWNAVRGTFRGLRGGRASLKKYSSLRGQLYSDLRYESYKGGLQPPSIDKYEYQVERLLVERRAPSFKVRRGLGPQGPPLGRHARLEREKILSAEREKKVRFRQALAIGRERRKIREYFESKPFLVTNEVLIKLKALHGRMRRIDPDAPIDVSAFALEAAASGAQLLHVTSPGGVKGILATGRLLPGTQNAFHRGGEVGVYFSPLPGKPTAGRVPIALEGTLPEIGPRGPHMITRNQAVVLRNLREFSTRPGRGRQIRQLVSDDVLAEFRLEQRIKQLEAIRQGNLEEGAWIFRELETDPIIMEMGGWKYQRGRAFARQHPSVSFMGYKPKTLAEAQTLVQGLTRPKDFIRDLNIRLKADPAASGPRGYIAELSHTVPYDPSHIARPTKVGSTSGGGQFMAFGEAEKAKLMSPQRLSTFRKLRQVAGEVEGLGGQLHIKGGYARELLIGKLRGGGRAAKDLDLLVTGELTSEQVYGILERHQAFADIEIQKTLTSAMSHADITINQAAIRVPSSAKDRFRLSFTEQAARDIRRNVLRVIDKSDPGRMVERLGRFKGYFPGATVSDDVSGLNEQLWQMRFSGSDEAHRVFDGLQEGGVAASIRKKFSDFGSGWDPLRAIARQFLRLGRKQELTEKMYQGFLSSKPFQKALNRAGTIRSLSEGGYSKTFLMEGNIVLPRRGLLGLLGFKKDSSFQFVHKRLHPGPQTPAFMLRELWAMRRLQGHPNVPTLYSAKRRYGHSLYMEYIPGEDAVETIAAGRHFSRGQIAELEQGLRAAHWRGIGHGDIWQRQRVWTGEVERNTPLAAGEELHPTNVMITPEGRVAIIDWGFAGPSGGTPASQSIEHAAASLGAGRQLSRSQFDLMLTASLRAQEGTISPLAQPRMLPASLGNGLAPMSVAPSPQAPVLSARQQPLSNPVFLLRGPAARNVEAQQALMWRRANGLERGHTKFAGVKNLMNSLPVSHAQDIMDTLGRPGRNAVENLKYRPEF